MPPAPLLRPNGLQRTLTSSLVHTCTHRPRTSTPRTKMAVVGSRWRSASSVWRGNNRGGEAAGAVRRPAEGAAVPLRRRQMRLRRAEGGLRGMTAPMATPLLRGEAPAAAVGGSATIPLTPMHPPPAAARVRRTSLPPGGAWLRPSPPTRHHLGGGSVMTPLLTPLPRGGGSVTTLLMPRHRGGGSLRPPQCGAPALLHGGPTQLPPLAIRIRWWQHRRSQRDGGTTPPVMVAMPRHRAAVAAEARPPLLLLPALPVCWTGPWRGW